MLDFYLEALQLAVELIEGLDHSLQLGFRENGLTLLLCLPLDRVQDLLDALKFLLVLADYLVDDMILFQVHRRLLLEDVLTAGSVLGLHSVHYAPSVLEVVFLLHVDRVVHWPNGLSAFIQGPLRQVGLALIFTRVLIQLVPEFVRFVLLVNIHDAAQV